ncbi:TatD family hydrolase [Cellulomonas xylanilytica]|uniref:AraC family transcriptional regulator n=1 Tax=Cellulomonas xylanilytica TaxID=233583 RepID=A0A510V7V4_9CELL|nr:TatD family hydrolase [Cellulomonas xylanilytica]GEK21350.1 AraC family transcriptional regulator [Cellulomonas xylanilytica]
MARSKGERGWPAPPEPLPVAVVDNHTHLDTVVTWEAEGWDPTLDDHLARAAAVGVTRMVQVGCDLDAIAWTDVAVRTHDALLGAVAIHPNEAVRHAGVRETAPDGLDPEPVHDVSLADAIARVEAVARANPRVRAIGETGLDHFRAGPRGRAVQREAFRTHVALAKELGLALQIHDRDAHDEVVEVLLADGAPDRTVFHCFSGDAELARLAVSHGWYLSFAGPVSFGANDALREALREVPPSLLLVETDAPYLTVHPFRGRPNAPYLLPGTVRTVADVTGRPLVDVCTALAATSEAVYGSW